MTRNTRTVRTPAPAPVREPEGLPDEAALAEAEAAFIASLNDEEVEPFRDLPPAEATPVLTPEIVQAMIRAAVAEALATQAPAAPVAVAAPVAENTELSSTYPVVYANPKIIDERFYVIGSPYVQRFVKGRFVAQNAEEEASVRACLEAHGRGFSDRWKGEDRREWTDRRTGFRTSNENARYDFELYHED